MNEAITHWISGPVLKARGDSAFVLREAVRVGERGLLGEVVRIQGDEIVVQVYEDTTGLRPGTRVEGTGRPLSIRLGPGLLGGVFDGLLRPISGVEEGAFVEPGTLQQKSRRFHFAPTRAVGERLGPGAYLGQATCEAVATAQHCLVPPDLPPGELVALVDEGEYDDDATICRLRDESGREHELSMRHYWPVRSPRPVLARLPSDQPMLTGQRVLDAILPLARGGKAAIPGGFGTGKTVLLETIAKWCHADVIVYVGCGERGNELAGLLDELMELEDPGSGRLLRERTVIIANTSNMPVSAREASIYTGVTVAEYFRDQGLHVALMADSTSRWAEALREVSGRLGELPGEGGYPAYLSSRLADFYERAARVRTLGGEEGSVTLMGAVSPPSGDFSEPVTAHTRRYIRTLWALDAERARARFYPAIHPLQSYSEDAPNLARWWHGKGCTRWSELRRLFLVLLEEQARLERMARIIGKDALPPRQRFTLLCADLVNEAFLRQSAYSENDRYATPDRQAVMMRLLGRFIELARDAVASGTAPEELTRKEVYRRLLRMGEDIAEGDWEQFSVLDKQIESTIAALRRGGLEAEHDD
jgi:V/A-type H+-transporting ATPase subunit A